LYYYFTIIASAVALGAFGAHGLKNRINDPRLLEVWNTAAHYHLIHSAVLAVAPFIDRTPNQYAAKLLIGGVTLFSGSLYLMTLTGNKKLGAITPIGGVAMIGGW
jgi:uncharacterized membrane protein YgdD (TMEM256/DUF423 family)